MRLIIINAAAMLASENRYQFGIAELNIKFTAVRNKRNKRLAVSGRSKYFKFSLLNSGALRYISHFNEMVARVRNTVMPITS